MENNENNGYQVCSKHPDRKTLLRCARCERPICMECAVSTPTGYVCKECVDKQQRRFNTGTNRDVAVTALTSFVLGLIGSLIDSSLRFFPVVLSIILGGLVGTLIVNAVRKACGNRRSDAINRTMVYASLLGAVLPKLRSAVALLSALFTGHFRELLSGSYSVGFSVLFIAAMFAAVKSGQNGFTFRR